MLNIEVIKKPVRRYIYPLINNIDTLFYRDRYKEYRPNLILSSERGNDYQRHRRRVNNFIPIKDKTLLIAGCGTGRDLHSYIPFRPKKIIAVDLFDYTDIYLQIQKRYRDTEIVFFKASLDDMGFLADGSTDIFSSDAVLEHCKDLSAVLCEASRVLKKDGVFYSTFGPLYFSWGGDHLSGYDTFENGFNHLVLDKLDYAEYVKNWYHPGGAVESPEDDPRLWVKNELYSFLKLKEYVSLLDSFFERAFLMLKINKRGERWVKTYPERAKHILQLHNLNELDLTTKSISCIGIKR